MSKTYNESGKARKQCPGCQVYVHARALNCPACGYVFGVSKNPPKEKAERVPKETEKREAVVFTEPGRGRKQCSCGTIVAARTRECPKCNQTIEKTASTVQEVKEKIFKVEKYKADKEPTRYVGTLVFAPAGQPPYPQDEDIEGWCSRVFAEGLKNNITYSNEALWYWYQKFNNDESCKRRILDWSRREGFDKMQEHRQEPELSIEEAETDTLQLLD